MIERIKNNIAVLIKYTLTCWGGLSAFAGVWLSFVTWDDMGITVKSHRILILIVLAAASLLISVIMIFFRNQKKIFGDINRGVTLCYGDIIKIGFPKAAGPKRIVVIPVNRCFDLSCEGNLVSRKTVHGQWIERYIRSDKDRMQIQESIQQSLNERNSVFEELTRDDKPGGNLKRYRPGTVVEVEGQDGIAFYLLALSQFDNALKAHCSEPEFYETLQGLLEYYDAHGQGEDLYCPIMGDHIVRPTRETGDMIALMLALLRFNKERIHGKIRVVVYDQMKKDIPILEY